MVSSQSPAATPAASIPPKTPPAPAMIDIKPLLRKLWPIPAEGSQVTADEIAQAISHFFTNQVSTAQAASLLIALHFTNLDRDAHVMAASAAAMRRAAAQVDVPSLRAVVSAKNLAAGAYRGGLCDIVGTGGDAHNTFNISTTASIVASACLAVSKHGNKASTSKSGSADLVAHMKPQAPVLAAVAPRSLADVYAATNYGFLFAPVFHPGMRFVAPLRRELPWRTIFNLLGPLASPVEDALEARVIGVARRELGPVFIRALAAAGCRKALVVCGEEELDEVSCAGPTLCWRLREAASSSSSSSSSSSDAEEVAPGVVAEHFRICPADFGLSAHPLDTVSPGKEPSENAEILQRILQGELPDQDPILEFVLMNTAALFVASGICEAESSAMGPGDDGTVVTERGPGGERWKEGVRRARWAIKSGEAWRQWQAFTRVTNEIGGDLS